MPRLPHTCRPHAPQMISAVEAPPVSRVLHRLRDLAISRHGQLPPWVLLTQVFLAAGWLRAASAHSMDPRWWDGAEIVQFRLEHRSSAIDWYQRTMLDGPVAEWPVATATIVIVAELIVAAMLLLNVRPLLALAIGTGLNVNFVLAGQVNPSVFYLVISAALALWHVEATVTQTNLRRLSSTSSILGALSLGALLPEITTIDPVGVIDDPAMVLCFVALLWVAALRLSLNRHKVGTPWPAGRRPADGVRVRVGLSPTMTPSTERKTMQHDPDDRRPVPRTRWNRGAI